MNLVSASGKLSVYSPTVASRTSLTWRASMEDDSMDIICHECKRGINPYEEKVHVWGGYYANTLLCDGCDKKRGRNIDGETDQK